MTREQLGLFREDVDELIDRGETRIYNTLTDAKSIIAHIDEQQRKIERMRDEMRRYLPILEALEAKPSSWEWFTDGTGIATLNGYRAALKEVGDERV